MSAIFASLTCFVLLYASAAAVYGIVYGNRRPIDERFADLAFKVRLADYGDGGGYTGRQTLSRNLLKWALERVPVPEPNSPRGERLSKMLVQAGFLRSASIKTFQLVRLGLCAAGAVLGAVAAILSKSDEARLILLTAAGAALGILITNYVLARRARIRQNTIGRQLSDVLDLLVVCVEAGLGVHEAIKIVGVECERQERAIGEELSIVSGEIAAGASLGQAMRALADRTAVEDIKPIAATLIQSEQLGAQIGPALRASSDALRARRKLRAEEAAQKTSIKILIPLVLFVLPAMLMLIIGPAIIQILQMFNR